VSKVPISDQIEALLATIGPTADRSNRSFKDADALHAALATLKWVERHQAELRVLGEFPGATVVRRDEE
jgi:hypothetical protein